MELKPIETVYKGYRFRSRLEARWAVFFDAAEIPFEYEPEGFDLPSGWYLPDFYLPEEKLYVEIKPHSLMPTREQLKSPLPSEVQSVFDLSKMSDLEAVVFYGDPVNVCEGGAYLLIHSGKGSTPAELLLGTMKAGVLFQQALKARQARFEHGAVLA